MQQVKTVSISTLEHLNTVNFSDCGSLVGAGWNGYPSGMAMKTDQIDMELTVPKEASSSSLPDNFVPKVKFTLHNCFDLDLEALLQQQSVFKQLILSCVEMPLYFTHKATGTSSSLTIPLLQTSLSQPFFRLRACAVIVFGDTLYFVGDIKINSRFKDGLGNHFDSPDHLVNIMTYEKGGHYLFVFDCCFPLEEDNGHLAELNYDHVDIQFHISGDSATYELKEWGIRLLEDYSSTENQLGDLNTLAHAFEADEDNMVTKIEHSEVLGTHDSTLAG